MKSLVARFVKDESGVTAIEYGLIAAAIAGVLAIAMPVVGSAINDIFDRIVVALMG